MRFVLIIFLIGCVFLAKEMPREDNESTPCEWEMSFDEVVGLLGAEVIEVYNQELLTVNHNNVLITAQGDCTRKDTIWKAEVVSYSDDGVADRVFKYGSTYDFAVRNLIKFLK